MRKHQRDQVGPLEISIISEWVEDLKKSIRAHLPVVGHPDTGKRSAYEFFDYPTGVEPGQRTYAWLVRMPAKASALDEFLWGLLRETLEPVAAACQRLDRVLTAAQDARLQTLREAFSQ